MTDWVDDGYGGVVAEQTPPLRIWAVSDGRAGIEGQVVGMAEALARQRKATVEVNTPGGVKAYEILKVEWV